MLVRLYPQTWTQTRTDITKFWIKDTEADTDIENVQIAGTDADTDIENFQIKDTGMTFWKNSGHDADKPRTHVSTDLCWDENL